MIVECIAIFAIIFAIMVIFLRTNRSHAIETVPLLILPGVNILGYFFAESISNLVPLDYFIVYVIINIAAVIASSILVGIFSLKFKSRHTKITYVVMCIVFNIVLASILIQNIYVYYVK